MARDFPYAGTSGSVRVTTSVSRARVNDQSGETSRNHRLALRHLRDAGYRGLTAAELRRKSDIPYNSASPTMTRLLMTGRVIRLNQKRGSSEGRKGLVHVLPEFVNGRDTIPYEPQGVTLSTDQGRELALRVAAFLSDRKSFKKPPSQEPHPGDREVAGMLRYVARESLRKEAAKRREAKRASKTGSTTG